MPATAPISEVAQATHDEKARQRFVSTLRKRLMVDMAGSLRRRYETVVEPAFRKQHRRAPRDGREVRRAMLPEPYFKAWSTLRYTAQQMTWWSVSPQVERAHAALRVAAGAVATQRGPGSLRLDPALPIRRLLHQRRAKNQVHHAALRQGCIGQTIAPTVPAQSVGTLLRQPRPITTCRKPTLPQLLTAQKSV
jgi:hypothetical protein